jgi:transposase
MARRSKRAPLVLNDDERERLTRLVRSRTAPRREVERADILLRYSQNEAITEIQRQTGVSRPSIYKCIDKALAAGIETGLKDKYHRPKEPVITPEDCAWVVSLACVKPKDLGLAAELWTISALVSYVREHAETAAHRSLTRVSRSTVWRILNEHEIKPHRIRYYLERRDEEFDEKMRQVLMVYREISMDLEAATPKGARAVYTVSVDEKPGVQALATSAPDLPPVPGKHAAVGRDHDYVRHGTVSILAGVDLHDGHIIAQVHDRHRSREFVELLQEIDAYYPAEGIIRVILDNHSSHISKETMRYLASRPGRFVYVHTPKHGSWLNLIEAVFSKMARTFLRHIRVSSKSELIERIMKGISEFNEHPVVFRWRNFEKLNAEV